MYVNRFILSEPSSRLITRAKPISTTTVPNKAVSTVTTKAKTVLTDAKPDATAPTKRKRAALGEIAGPSKNQKEKPASKRTTKVKPKEKFDGVVLKSTVTMTTTTSTIRQPLKAVTGAVLLSITHAKPTSTTTIQSYRPGRNRVSKNQVTMKTTTTSTI